MGDIIVGIDIGTSKVCTMIGRVNKVNEFDVAGVGIEPCSGIKKGTIVDIESTSHSIKTSVSKAESMAGIKVSSAYINITGLHVSVINNKSWINIGGENREVTQNDVERLMYTVEDISIPENRQIIDVVARQFIIDGYDEIMDPVGMVGVKLEVEADIIAGKITSVQNIVKSVEKSGIKVDGLIVEAMSSGEILLTPEDRELGTILLDVGAGITDVSVFKNKRLIFYDSIPVGGDHITSDISIGLKIPYAEAEKFKKEYELALASLIKNDQEVAVTDINDGRKKSVMVSEIVEIIEARVYEIFSLGRELLEKAGINQNVGVSVVLTGEGISHLDGSIQLAYEVFEVPVRIASYRIPGAFKPEYTTVAGIVKYVAGQKKSTGSGGEIKDQRQGKPNRKSGIMANIANFLKKLFFTL